MIKILRTYLIVLLGAVLFVECSGIEIDLYGSIYGIISDSDTSEPLSGVTVNLSPIGASVTTGSSGMYEFGDLEAGSYSLLLSKNGYNSDTKSITVAPGTKTVVDMSLSTANGSLSLSSTSLDFGTSDLSLSFSISNTGNGSLNYSIDNQYDWLTLSSSSGTIESGRTTSIIVSIDRGLITESKSVNLPISSDAGSAVVSIMVTHSVATAELYVTPSSLDFGETRSVDYVVVKNNGTADLTFEFLGIEDWFSATCSKYTLTPGESTTATVTIDRSKFSTSASGTLIISSNVGNASVALSATEYVPTPNLVLYVSEVDFGETLIYQTFTVYNTGDAAMTFSVNETLSWLSASYTGSVAAGSSSVVTLTLDRSNVYGEVSENISIVSDGGSASLTVKAYEPIDYGTVVSPYVDFDISISEAYLTGTTLYVDFLITYTGTSTCDLRIYPASYSAYNTNANDDLGYYYKSSMSLSLGGSYYTSLIEDIQPNTVIRGVVKIENINSDATKMLSIMLDSFVRYGTSYTYEYIKFSNVPIIR